MGGKEKLENSEAYQTFIYCLFCNVHNDAEIRDFRERVCLKTFEVDYVATSDKCKSTV